MKIDNSWSGTKKSLAGLGAFLLVLTIFYVLEASGLIGFILAIVAWYLTYTAMGKTATKEK